MSYKVQKPCNVCGRLYTPCGDCERDNTAFHWRTVACSYKCGQEYLRRVMEARSKDEKIDPTKEEASVFNTIKEETPPKKTFMRTDINKNKKESE